MKNKSKLIQTMNAKPPTDGGNINDWWRTPPEILVFINSFFDPDGWFDPCPASPTFDGLSIPWPKRVYCNPPFSHYPLWAAHAMKQDSEMIFMCHHNHDRKFFKKLLTRATAICMLYARVQFLHPTDNSKRTTCPGNAQSLIYVGNRVDRFREVFQPKGLVVPTIWPRGYTPS